MIRKTSGASGVLADLRIFKTRGTALFSCEGFLYSRQVGFALQGCAQLGPDRTALFSAVAAASIGDAAELWEIGGQDQDGAREALRSTRHVQNAPGPYVKRELRGPRLSALFAFHLFQDSGRKRIQERTLPGSCLS